MSPLYVKVFHGCIQKLSSSWYFSWNYFLRLQFSHCVIVTWSKVTLLLFSAHWQPSSSAPTVIFISQHVFVCILHITPFKRFPDRARNIANEIYWQNWMCPLHVWLSVFALSLQSEFLFLLSNNFMLQFRTLLLKRLQRNTEETLIVWLRFPLSSLTSSIN